MPSHIIHSFTTLLRVFILAAILVFLTSSTLQAQDPTPNPVLERITILQGPPLADAGGGGRDNHATADDLTDVHARIEERVRTNVARLRTQGKLASPDATAQVKFIWPVSTPLSDFGYFGISNYVDHDASYPNHLLDYNGGMRTYDLDTGYNHPGTDIFLWPFPWLKVDQNAVSVIAAAAGVIADKGDGNFDRSCSWVGTGDPNYVVLTHADGSESWYLHMKNGSITPKAVGQTVAAGEYLGVVASSGFSNGPHLHFEVRGSSNQMIDPWAGPSNPTTLSSWWKSQKPYYDPGINKLTTGLVEPINPNCAAETPNQVNEFEPGSEIYYTSYFHDQLDGTQVQLTVLRPDGSAFVIWDDLFDQYYAASWWWWSGEIPANEPGGAWKFRAEYQGKTYDYPFYVCKGSPIKPKLLRPLKNAVVGTKAKLKWEDTPCADTYSVTVRQGSKTGPVILDKTGLTKLKATVKNLASGTKFFWRVSACNDQDCTAAKWWSFFTP